MKQVAGIFIPDSDEHFVKMLAGSPRVDGKGTYQLQKLQAAMTFVPQDRRRLAIDVGGHVGLWSRILAKFFGQVVAFEPLPAHIECFRANVTATNVDLLETAVGRQIGTVSIAMPEDNTGHAHVRSDGGHAVLCTTLDAIGHGIFDVVDFLKIDVEGFEYEVLLGAERVIRSTKPVIIVEQKPDNAEVQGRGQWDAVKLLKDWGMVEKQVMAGDHIMAWQ